MPIEKLEAEHRRILVMADALEKLVDGPCPAAPDALARSRANFTRDLFSHFSSDEALVLLPLMSDRRPHIAQLASQSRTQLQILCGDIEAHIERWTALPSEREWPEYRRSVKCLMRRLRARVAAEETGLHHFLPAQRSANQEPDPTTSHWTRERAYTRAPAGRASA